MKTFYITLLLLAILLFSCNSNENKYRNLDSIVNSKIALDYSFENISIPIDSITINTYPIFCNYDIDSNNYLAGYNSKMNTIDVFDLSNKKIHDHIFLKKEGPNSIEYLDGFFIHNWDSIFVNTGFALKIIDSKGNVKATWDIGEFNIVKSGKVGSIGSTIDFFLHYSKKRNSVFFKYTPRNVVYSSKEFFKQPFIAEFSLANNSLDLLPILYSNFFVENNNVGYLFCPMVSFYDDIVYYGFEGESNIYTYNLQTKEYNAFGARSKYSKNLTDILPESTSEVKKAQHRIESVSFFNIIYDPYRKFFYRLHYCDQKYQVSKNLFNTYNDKLLSIMIFDNKFKLIKEIQLDKQTFYSEFWCVTLDGLLLNANHELNANTSENYINFKLLRFNII
ncbi:MAG: DUF4221 domain-containing protein [Bacteroidales bacterium]|nr:MAG: DUF4221 domain-containing protein [Bacteroidales bacterium]